MEHTKIAVALGILALVVAGMFTFTYLKKVEIAQESTIAPVVSEEETASPYAGITRIEGKYFYEAPTHTIVGEILMPTPCDLLNWDVRVQESMPETAVIDFRVINNADMCAQMVTPQRFSVSFDASKEATVRATLTGRSVELNLIPALPGESPADFELFIKG